MKMIVKDMGVLGFLSHLTQAWMLVNSCCRWGASSSQPLPASTTAGLRDDVGSIWARAAGSVSPFTAIGAECRFSPGPNHCAEPRCRSSRYAYSEDKVGLYKKDHYTDALKLFLSLSEVKWHIRWSKRASKEEYMSLLTLARQRVQPLRLPPPWCAISWDAIKTRNNDIKCCFVRIFRKNNHGCFKEYVME